jgi:thiamine kinase-like enzyme
MSVQRALQTVPGFANAKVIKKLAQGITGETFLVERGAEEFVLRIRSSDASLFVTDGFAEHRLARFAHEAGLAPEPVFCSTDGQLSLRRFVQGAVWSPAALTCEGLERLAALLGCLHQIPVRFEPGDWANDALLRYSEKASPEASWALRLGQRALEDIHEYKAVAALCHGDVVCGNIIQHDAALQLIDWEYSRVADPYFDLASFLVHHDIDPAAKQFLVTAYSRSVGGIVEGRLRAWVKYYESLQTLWLLTLEQKRLINPAQKLRLRKCLPG